MRNKLGLLAIVFIVLQVLLVIASWMITAAFPELQLHSLLSEEGIRWFSRNFADNMKTDVLVWMLLGVTAYGAFRTSGLSSFLYRMLKERRALGSFSYRERIGFRVVLAEILFFIVLTLMMTMLPQAVLLSVTGHLFPSSFSESLIPYLALVVTVCSLSYGVMCGQLKSLGETYESFSSGFRLCAHLFPIYILIAEFISSFVYVFQSYLHIYLD
ncbi:AbgT family transporter [Prevotella sp. HUN102]|uniref:AbgT family transporter n=1 Tax=Prevotella sp. HUN102 TaxID=1392486 RepID=UPI00048C6E57|nr:AbgT family transporter [Prevotella sp. HUN102]